MALKGFGRYTVAANTDGTSSFSLRSIVESNDFNNLTGTNIIPSASTKNLLDSFLSRDLKTIHELGRDIYHNDPISGATVDLLSNLPYSDFNLSTVDEKHVLDTYLKGMENMRLSTLIPDIARDRYVIGCFIGILNFNKKLRVYDSVLPQNIDETEIIEVPIHGMDPLITVRPSAAIKKLVALGKTDKRITPIINSLPDFLVEAAQRRKKIAIDPMNLLFMKRGGMAVDHLGRSLYSRIYLIWLIEKALMRGTVDQAYKRQRGILHLQVGEEDWVPTASELQQLADLFIQADLDSTGATIATRNGINANELRCLSGDTIIPTSKGLMRIADMVDHDPKKLKAGTAFNTDILVKNHLGKYVKVSDWWYQGFKPTFRITTESGSHITCTENHKFPTIVNGEYKLIKAKDLLVGKSHVLRSTLPKSEKVTSITECKKEHVYDLTMDARHSAPYFIANGFITKNSGGEFWKVGDISDWAGQQKLRAFGVSEAFLSGDSSYSTVDAALSVFMDNIRTERNFLTQELFYDKIFPAIAIANDFKKSKKHLEMGSVEELAQYTQRDRFSVPYRTGVYRDAKTNKLVGVYSGNRSSTIASSLNSINDITQYVIPELHWHKQLKPEGDSNYIQILQELQQLGVPIPLRMIAAAGGIDVDKLLQGKEDDINLRRSLSDYQKEIQKLAGQPGDDGMGQQEEAALKFISKLGNGGSVKKVAFKDREFGDLLEPYQLDKSGNKRVLSKKGKETVNERFNKALAAATAEKARQSNWKLKNGIEE